MVGLATASLAAAVTFAGGLYATQALNITDMSSATVGAGAANPNCDDSIEIQSGLARFHKESKNFLIGDITLADVNPQCVGLNTTIVGIDHAGAPVTQGQGLASANTFTVALAVPVPPGAVAEWRVVLQNTPGDAGVDNLQPLPEGGESQSATKTPNEPETSEDFTLIPVPDGVTADDPAGQTEEKVGDGRD